MALFLGVAAATFVGGLGAGSLVLNRIGRLQADGPQPQSCEEERPTVVFVLGGPGTHSMPLLLLLLLLNPQLACQGRARGRTASAW
jgi:hypothetical protein